MKTITPYLFLILIFSSVTEASMRAPSADLEHNKKVVIEFYDLAFNQHKPQEAMQKYGGQDYIQHNPFVATGKQPFIDFFAEFHKSHPDSHAEVKRVVAEGDLVVVHVHSTSDRHDRGRAVMDIFRLENGKIVEHWDVGQPIPEKAANSNTMF
jgi:predicted SnoaL-like aldol condensation-catalyzing enzyme